MKAEQHEEVRYLLHEVTLQLSLLAHAATILAGLHYSQPRRKHAARMLAMAKEQMTGVGGALMTASLEGHREELDRMRHQIEEVKGDEDE